MKNFNTHVEPNFTYTLIVVEGFKVLPQGVKDPLVKGGPGGLLLHPRYHRLHPLPGPFLGVDTTRGIGVGDQILNVGTPVTEKKAPLYFG